MKKILVCLILIIGTFTYSYAQDYKTAIGLRGGPANGITVKHFISGSHALEGIVTSRWHGFSFTGLYEIHKPAFDVNRLNWYYGLGAHIGFWNGNDVHWKDDHADYTVIGVDAILALEYTFVEIPFNISIDWKPAFNFAGYTGFWYDSGAISIRYTF